MYLRIHTLMMHYIAPFAYTPSLMTAQGTDKATTTRYTGDDTTSTTTPETGPTALSMQA